MGTMVVGIFKDHDAVAKLADTIKASGLDIERLKVITSETPSDDLVSSGVEFILSGEPNADAMGSGTGIITGFGGMSVPGLTDETPKGAGMVSSGSDELLAELSIPDGRSDDYTDAIDSGRSVAGFAAGPDVDKVKALFSAAGGTPVEVF